MTTRFRERVRAHIQRPDQFPAPPEFQLYQIERRLWEQFGAAQPPIVQWPARKLVHYVTIIQCLDEQEREQNAKATDQTRALGPATPPGRSAAPQNMERLRALATPPPTPPPVT